MPWIRHGECNRCGDCCRSGNPFKHLSVRESTVEGLYEDMACSMFKYIEVDGKKLGTCMLRTGEIDNVPDEMNNYHEVACTKWPEHPSNIQNYPNCSYTFEWVD